MIARFIACFLLLLATPVIILFGLLIKLVSPGPIFFRQLREGKSGRKFHIWKLRTMSADAGNKLALLLAADPERAAEWTVYGGLKNDPRIAGKAGLLARKLSVDELPQLINIINGDMAFVGPRPLELQVAKTLPWQDRMARNTIKPGLTGLWQIGARNSSSISAMQRYDKLYLRKKSFTLDMYILFKTVGVVLRQTGV